MSPDRGNALIEAVAAHRGVALIGPRFCLSYPQLFEQAMQQADHMANFPAATRFYTLRADATTTLSALLGAERSAQTFVVGLNRLPPAAQARAIETFGLQDLSARRPARAKSANAQSAAPFYAGFTSASSAEAKCFCRHGESWLQSYQALDQAFDLCSIKTLQLAASLDYSLGLFFAMWALHRGKTIVQDGHAANEDSDMWVGTPGQFKMAFKSHRAPKVVLLGGSALSPNDLQRWQAAQPNTRFLGFYGASETSFISFVDYATQPLQSVGRIANGVKLRVVDGQILVNTPQAFAGYLLDQTQQLSQVDRWIALGDHGYIGDDGYLYLLGREQRSLDLRGQTIYLDVLEAALGQHPDIQAAAVVAATSTEAPPRVQAFIVGQATLGSLRQWIRTHLGMGYDLHRLRQIDSLPYTDNGKPDYAKLLQEASDHER